MFQVAIILNDTTANLSLSFKTKEKAIDAHIYFNKRMSVNEVCEYQDDYDYIVSIKANSISYILFIDIAKSQECDFEKNMCVNEAREQLGKRLETMGFKPQPSKSRIIQ